MLLDVARGHPQRSMMLAAHLFALTVSQRRAIAALASGEAPFSQTAARQHGTSKGATGKALAALAQAGDIAEDPTAATGWVIIDPLMHEWLRRRGRD